MWIGLLVAGMNVTIFGATFFAMGLMFVLLIPPMLPPLPMIPFLFWTIYGMLIAGGIITVVGIIILLAGYLRYRREREYDLEKGFAKIT
jgi:hypothetical protein